MPIYKFVCNKCQKQFDKILSTLDISSITCSACASPDVKRVLTEGGISAKGNTAIPAGALSGGSCKTGFS